MNKPSIPKGMRDFGPQEMLKRNYIFDTIKSVFQQFGYRQIETPAQENLSTLLGKYGEEGDRLLFRILNSGDFLSKVPDNLLAEKNASALSKCISEKGLRYDLTVPFARFVVQHRNEIALPFKRYQIQPVWRADRPQKGRYREFYQCDVDAVGTNSLLLEAELIELVAEVFKRLGVNTRMHINNRKILAGIAETIGATDQLVDLTVAMDKLDKVGLEGVLNELKEKGFEESKLEKFMPFLRLSECKNNEDRLAQLEKLLGSSEVGAKGIAEMRDVLSLLPAQELTMKILFDPALARGLGYYTGTIMEVKAEDVAIGSISGGGRYDNLTGIFGMDGISGVGISLGADRIYDVLEQLDLFPKSINKSADLLFVNFSKEETLLILPLVRELRSKGYSVIIYPDAIKMAKQFSYADALHIPYVAIAGSNEIKEGKVTLKKMNTGEQTALTNEELLHFLAANINKP